MTIKYDPREGDLRGLEMGAQAYMLVAGYAADDLGQAVLVRPSTIGHNKHPHVTVAVAPGVEAVYSNILLDREVRLVLGPRLTGVVDIRID